jgi:peptide deformylase
MIRKSQLNLVPETSPILHTPPEEFDFNGDIEAEMFVNILIDRMHELGGVGLSANQVGVNKQVFVIGMDNVYMGIINPKIISYEGPEVLMKEGCLTFPGIMLSVNRPKAINVEYYNVKGEKVEEKLSGMTARIFLHEYDHMLGKTFKERASKLKWDLAQKKVNKRIKQHVKNT